MGGTSRKLMGTGERGWERLGASLLPAGPPLGSRVLAWFWLNKRLGQLLHPAAFLIGLCRPNDITADHSSLVFFSQLCKHSPYSRLLSLPLEDASWNLNQHTRITGLLSPNSRMMWEVFTVMFPRSLLRTYVLEPRDPPALGSAEDTDNSGL